MFKIPLEVGHDHTALAHSRTLVYADRSQARACAQLFRLGEDPLGDLILHGWQLDWSAPVRQARHFTR
jgi:hypothetical protein